MQSQHKHLRGLIFPQKRCGHGGRPAGAHRAGDQQHRSGGQGRISSHADGRFQMHHHRGRGAVVRRWSAVPAEHIVQRQAPLARNVLGQHAVGRHVGRGQRHHAHRARRPGLGPAAQRGQGPGQQIGRHITRGQAQGLQFRHPARVIGKGHSAARIKAANRAFAPDPSGPALARLDVHVHAAQEVACCDQFVL